MKNFKYQLFPILLTILIFFCLTGILFFFLQFLNHFPAKEKVQIVLRPIDMLVGMTVYAKTSIDFAIFMGNLMHTNPGWKKRIAIEIGTALGNGIGTMLILGIWFFFKEIPILMILMIFLASVVLLEMAEEGLRELQITNYELRMPDKASEPWKPTLHNAIVFLYNSLHKINAVFKPLLSRILPGSGVTTTKTLAFFKLLPFALAVPFILGLDDFAGYIPLFTIVNVFSFATGVFLAHMLLNAGLFAFPEKTTRITRHPFVIAFGSIVFIGLAVLGLFDIIKIVSSL